MTYLLDANVFIEAKNTYYGFAIVPGFWDWITAAHSAGKVFTVRSVADEVSHGTDSLAGWMKAMPSSFKLDLQAADVSSMTALATWVQSGQRGFTRRAIDEFLDSADYRLVAQAKASQHVVVTREAPAPLSKARVKIPDACNEIQVAYMTPFEMLHAEGAAFS